MKRNLLFILCYTINYTLKLDKHKNLYKLKTLYLFVIKQSIIH